ncbi:MAG: hypothetical protein IIA05_09860 [Proteobacteria bacterium]|nr:hypothetical protein [Pseudomonadota bacterium]
MKNTKIAQVTSLFVAAFLLAAVNIIVVPDTALAAPKSDCKGKKADRPIECDDDSESGNLQAKFDLTIETTTPNISGGPYQDSKRGHVSISTGSGDGFRFDTNTQNVNKLSRWRSAEVVSMSVPRAAPSGSDIADYEIDFRFNQTTGLDLGSLEAGRASGTVAAAFKYFGGHPVDGFDVSNHGVLGFMELTTSPPISPDDNTCLEDTRPIEVKRNGDDTWTLRSTGDHLACAFAIDANGDIECTHSTPCSSNGGDGPEAIPFEFEFTLTQQP